MWIRNTLFLTRHHHPSKTLSVWQYALFTYSGAALESGPHRGVSFELLEGFEGVEVRVGVVKPDNKPHRNKIVLQRKKNVLSKSNRLIFSSTYKIFKFCGLFGFYSHHQCSKISEAFGY
jgi:hypothetical protein